MSYSLIVHASLDAIEDLNLDILRWDPDRDTADRIDHVVSHRFVGDELVIETHRAMVRGRNGMAIVPRQVLRIPRKYLDRVEIV